MEHKRTEKEELDRMGSNLFVLWVVMMAGLACFVKFIEFMVVSVFLRAVGFVGLTVGRPLLWLLSPVFRWVIFPVYDALMAGATWLWHFGGGGLRGWGLIAGVIAVACVLCARAIFFLEHRWDLRKQTHNPTMEVCS